MVLLEKHAQEAFWLQRRIDFLHKLDDLVEEGGDMNDARRIAEQYKKVENPEDVIKRMREIYGRDIQ